MSESLLYICIVTSLTHLAVHSRIEDKYGVVQIVSFIATLCTCVPDFYCFYTCNYYLEFTRDRQEIYRIIDSKFHVFVRPNIKV